MSSLCFPRLKKLKIKRKHHSNLNLCLAKRKILKIFLDTSEGRILIYRPRGWQIRPRGTSWRVFFLSLLPQWKAEAYFESWLLSWIVNTFWARFCFKNWKAPACTKGERQMVKKYIFLKNSFLADKHSGDLQKSLLSKYEGNRLQVFAWRFAFFEARGKHPHKSVDRIIEKESATGGTRKFRMTNPASWCLSMFHVWLLEI